MKEWRIVMGMPVTIEIVGSDVDPGHFQRLFSYFEHVEGVFSPFRPTSETSRVNHGLLRADECSDEMKTVMRLAEKTRQETKGYFDVYRNGVFNPVGLVKGWAVYQASEMLRHDGVWDFFIDAGGDVQLSGRNESGDLWAVGIRNPFDQREIVKFLRLSDMGIATSGTYARGHHIYDPFAAEGDTIDEIVSLTVIGPNVYEADRFATAAFAMGPDGIEFIRRESGFEGYMIGKNGIATMTPGFAEYVAGGLPAASSRARVA
jgi:thiamine biosynthesis lipoprotein